MRRGALALAVALSGCANSHGLGHAECPLPRVEVPVGDEGFIPATERDFGQANVSLASRLGLPPLCGVDIVLARSRDAFDSLVRKRLGYAFHRSPSRKSLIGVSGNGATVLLSPSAYATDSAYAFAPETYAMLVAHEATHLFHFRANPTAARGPPVLNEGLGVFLSGQYHRLEEFREPVSDALERNVVPSVEAILTDPRLAYPWGWTLVGAIDAADGTQALGELMAASEPGEALRARVTVDGFDTQWRAWIRQELAAPRMSDAEGASASPGASAR